MSRSGEGPGDLVPDIMIRISIVAPNRAPTIPRTPPNAARATIRSAPVRTMRKRPAPEKRVPPSPAAARRRARAAGCDLVDARQQQHAADHPASAAAAAPRTADAAGSRVRSPPALHRLRPGATADLRCARASIRARSSTRISARACSIDTPSLSRAAVPAPPRDRIASAPRRAESRRPAGSRRRCRKTPLDEQRPGGRDRDRARRRVGPPPRGRAGGRQQRQQLRAPLRGARLFLRV